jgi:hypothetical protein
VISGFGRDVDKICALLRYYAALSGISVPTFRENLLVQPSSVKKSKQKAFPGDVRWTVSDNVLIAETHITEATHSLQLAVRFQSLENDGRSSTTNFVLCSLAGTWDNPVSRTHGPIHICHKWDFSGQPLSDLFQTSDK